MHVWSVLPHPLISVTLWTLSTKTHKSTNKRRQMSVTTREQESWVPHGTLRRYVLSSAPVRVSLGVRTITLDLET